VLREGNVEARIYVCNCCATTVTRAPGRSAHWRRGANKWMNPIFRASIYRVTDLRRGAIA
jgi:hypothetical protein